MPRLQMPVRIVQREIFRALGPEMYASIMKDKKTRHFTS